MKKLKFFLPLSLFLLAVLLICFLIFAPDSVRKALFSRVKTYNSSTRIIAENEVLKLKTSQFDLDFLISIETAKNKKYLALYPYRVVAGIDLSTVNEKTLDDGSKKIILNPPKILQSGTALSNEPFVLRDNLGSALNDYEAFFKPVKRALEQKACDLALENGLFENCIKNACKVYEGFGYSVLVTEAEDEIKKFSASRLPVSFSFSSASKLSLVSEVFPSRDDSSVFINGNKSILFGALDSSPKDFSFDDFIKRQKSFVKEGRAFLQISHPFGNDKKRSVFFADKYGYGLSKIFFKNGDNFYLSSVEDSAQRRKNEISWALIYAGLNVDFTEEEENKLEAEKFYRKFIQEYDNACNFFEQKSFNAAEESLKVIKEEFGFNEDCEKLSSLTSLLYRNEFIPIKDDPEFNRLLEIAFVLKTNKYSQFNFEARKKLIQTFNSDEISRLTLKQVFLNHAGELDLTDEEIISYTDDLIQTASIISKSLFINLDEEKRNEYIKNIILRKTDAIEQKFSNMTFLSLDDLSAKKDLHSLYNTIQKELKKKFNPEDSIVPENYVTLLYTEKKLFGSRTSALVFFPEHLTIFENLNAGFSNSANTDVFYQDIKLTNNKLTIGKTTFLKHPAEQIMKELSRTFSDDNYYAFELSSDFVNKLSKMLTDKMTRPGKM